MDLRSAFNQVRVLEIADYANSGRYVGLDVKAMRTQSAEAGTRASLEQSGDLYRSWSRSTARFPPSISRMPSNRGITSCSNCGFSSICWGKRMFRGIMPAASRRARGTTIPALGTQPAVEHGTYCVRQSAVRDILLGPGTRPAAAAQAGESAHGVLPLLAALTPGSIQMQIVDENVEPLDFERTRAGRYRRR